MINITVIKKMWGSLGWDATIVVLVSIPQQGGNVFKGLAIWLKSSLDKWEETKLQIWFFVWQKDMENFLKLHFIGTKLLSNLDMG